MVPPFKTHGRDKARQAEERKDVAAFFPYFFSLFSFFSATSLFQSFRQRPPQNRNLGDSDPTAHMDVTQCADWTNRVTVMSGL
jgi:hypothetical protein